jgi:hypothetical protein
MMKSIMVGMMGVALLTLAGVCEAASPETNTAQPLQSGENSAGIVTNSGGAISAVCEAEARATLTRFYNALLSTHRPAKQNELNLFAGAEASQGLLRDFSLDVPAQSASPLLDFFRRHRYLFASEQVQTVADIRIVWLAQGDPTRVSACSKSGGDQSNAVIFAITKGRIDVSATRVFPPTGVAITPTESACIRANGAEGMLLADLIEERVAEHVLMLVQWDEVAAMKIKNVVNAIRADANRVCTNKNAVLERGNPNKGPLLKRP